MKSDNELKREIAAELEFDPSIRHGDIAVSVRDGVVTLAGTVDTYVQRGTAQRAVERVKGVRAIANDLVVALPSENVLSDSALAHAVADALAWDVEVPRDRVRVAVAEGGVTLTGAVDWEYQRRAAERCVRNLRGVKTLTNRITVEETPLPADVKERIADTLRRQAVLDAGRIVVETSHHTVILKGTVRSVAEKHDAERAAWRAPGVTAVENRLEIEPLAPVLA